MVEERPDPPTVLGVEKTAIIVMWRRATIDELSRLGHVILCDRRGCTRSERPDPHQTSVVQHAEDAAALLEALEAVPAVVIGRSCRGETCDRARAAAPRQCAGPRAARGGLPDP